MTTLADIGVSEAKKKQFARRNIFDANDLLHFVPRTYKDYSAVTGLRNDMEDISAIVQVERLAIFSRPGITPTIRATCVEKDTGKKLTVLWFRKNYLWQALRALERKTVFIAGKISDTNSVDSYTISMPVIFEEYTLCSQRIVPVYRSISGMSADYLIDKVTRAISYGVEEVVPQKYLNDYPDMVSEYSALCKLHFPRTHKDVWDGQVRMLFDDLLFYALGNEIAARRSSASSSFSILPGSGFSDILQHIPFALTKDQDHAVKEMLDLMGNGTRLNALLQGDVGCGKTIVAMLLMIAAADSGYQSILMAPTQILAKQHFDELSALCEKVGYRAVFLGSRMKKKEKEKAYADIQNGEADFVVGTHAILSDKIEFKSLGLMIVDEEHKFGVKQRNSIVERMANGVHSVTMSATPIPRSFASALYGNGIEVFTIKEKPAGRKDVITMLVDTVSDVCHEIAKEVKNGHQAYIVCPLIEDSDNEIMKDIKSVETVEKECGEFFCENGITYATVTGQNKKEETEKIIEEYKNGNIDVLIATTVIEVGVNVPSATVMAIMDANRFGLSSLHQLRGRVGRSMLQSYCILQSDGHADNERLQAMVKEKDGFKIAEADLKIRGGGDFLGTEQSGHNEYVELVMQYPNAYNRVQKVAKSILDNGDKCILLDRVTAQIG